MRKERNHPNEQAPIQRKKNFLEVTEAFTKEEALAEASRCLNCKNAPCIKGCPVGVNIPGFIGEIVKGDLEKSGEIIKNTNYLPAVCGRVCPQEEQCESLCVRNKLEGSVSIGCLERFVADYMLENGQNVEESPADKPFKVAIIGSGPSSLTCAADCRKEGLDVTIFEAFHKAGGVLTYGIPEFRLPKKIVQKEIDNLLKMGVKLELNTVINKTITLNQLQEEYDAIFIGTGAGLPQFLNIKGENLNGVYAANEYLTRINLMKAYEEGSHTPITRGKNVVVLGGGNVAVDAARSALRLDADSVSIIYRRSRNEMPARDEEVRHAEEEGINLCALTQPIEIIGENGRVVSIKCQKCQLGEVDKSGRRQSVLIENSEFLIPCDTVIVAIGTSPNPLILKGLPDLKVTPKGTVIVDENMQTSINNIYAGGDAVTGAATVIQAMGAGKAAAKSIISQSKS